LQSIESLSSYLDVQQCQITDLKKYWGC